MTERPGSVGATTPRAPTGLRTWPWWAQVLAVHAVARVVSTVVLLGVARTQAANLWTPAAPSYLEYTGLMWDGAWYREIATEGYPDGLPTDADGRVQQNAWAFFPLFPLLVRALMLVTGGPWHVLAPLTALVLGAAAMLVVHRVVEVALAQHPRRDGPTSGPAGRRRVALATVAVLTTAPAAPVLQVAYTESLALLLLASALLLVLRRQYLAAVPVVLALGLTRAVALPMLLVIGVHLVVRVRAHRAGQEPWPGPERGRLVLLTVVAAVAGVLWPVLVGWATGDLRAYALTQAAWRGGDTVVPLRPWFDVGWWLFGPVGPVVVVAVVLLAAVAVLSGPSRRLGPELQAWSGGYLGYLLLVLEPGTSLVRFTLLAFPLAGALALGAAGRRSAPVRRVWLGAVLVLGVVGQIAWVALLWRLVPPSGWPP